jgi:hypothetical protein
MRGSRLACAAIALALVAPSEPVACLFQVSCAAGSCKNACP